ncbi:Protein Star [Eufriesea mexicana]|uniref:Protein Star n=1 Tax=Eufriesea mexicana TaxID=516756 RepID=A0A310S6Z9_9HYME|nr:Protein Star [Eufriesea mexicana]
MTLLLGIVSIILIQQFFFASYLPLNQTKHDTYSKELYRDGRTKIIETCDNILVNTVNFKKEKEKVIICSNIVFTAVAALSRWYNFTDDVIWYNDKVQSPSNPRNWQRYMMDIRRNWILWKYNPNYSYNLENPEIEDPSMGQASKNGFFVECGAYDGETRSNTLVLERFLDWSGLLIEADPLNFSKMLQKNRKAYLTPTCLAIEPYPSVNSFLMANNVGRLHEPNASDSHLPNSPDVAHSGIHVSVQCFPFIHLMYALNVTTVNYFSLDIEGHELKVLKTIPFDMINIETLSVEFSHVENGKKELIDFMESKGYYVYSLVVRSDNLAHDVIFVKYDYEKTNLVE